MEIGYNLEVCNEIVEALIVLHNISCLHSGQMEEATSKDYEIYKEYCEQNQVDRNAASAQDDIFQAFMRNEHNHEASSSSANVPVPVDFPKNN